MMNNQTPEAQPRSVASWGRPRELYFGVSLALILCVSFQSQIANILFRQTSQLTWKNNGSYSFEMWIWRKFFPTAWWLRTAERSVSVSLMQPPCTMQLSFDYVVFNILAPLLLAGGGFPWRI